MDTKEINKTDKITRMISLYHKLVNGEVIDKISFMTETGITDRTFFRDLDDIRLFLSEIYSSSELLFDKNKNGYYLTGYTKTKFSSIEIIVILKILLDSRAFQSDEISKVMHLIIRATPVYEQSALRSMVEDELQNYHPLRHNKNIFNHVWELEEIILRREKIFMQYTKANGDSIEWTVIPLSVMFSEFYFYLVAFIDNKKHKYPTFFRVDRITSFESLGKHDDAQIYKSVNTAEIKNRLQFMQGGQPMKIKFKFWGDSLEAVLDRLPISEVVGMDGNKAIIEAEVFGRGIKMWLLSQAQFIEVIEPSEFRDEMKETIKKMMANYN